jgi:hypothetical protein
VSSSAQPLALSHMQLTCMYLAAGHAEVSTWSRALSPNRADAGLRACASHMHVLCGLAGKDKSRVLLTYALQAGQACHWCLRG